MFVLLFTVFDYPFGIFLHPQTFFGTKINFHSIILL